MNPTVAFQCPGETRPISHSLHLARLAAGHPGCRSCSHRNETGWLPAHIAARVQSRTCRQVDPLVTPDGLRGRYINQLTREKISDIVEHLVEMLAGDCVREGVRRSSHGLRILTGYDSRPTSPDLAIGLVSTLKKWGCEIVDLGQASRPLFDWALERLRPDAGLFVTGGNRNQAWNGLDIIDHHGLPWCLPGKLQELEGRLLQTSNRTSRIPGHYEAIPLTAEYETALNQQFHAIRPLRLAVIAPDVLVRNFLKQQLEQTSCSVMFLTGQYLTEEGSDRSSKIMVETLCERRLDAGFVIGADGRSCRLFDEGGYELTLQEVLKLLSQTITAKTSDGLCWIAQSYQPAENMIFEGRWLTRGTEADLLLAQRMEQIPIAADSAHRFWFRDESPACDAIQTLAKVLEVLSLSERPVSSYGASRKQAQTVWPR